jgi:hypothetical protein
MLGVSVVMTPETAIKSSDELDVPPERVVCVGEVASVSTEAKPADLFPISAAIATENRNKSQADRMLD